MEDILDNLEYINKNKLQVIDPDGFIAVCCLWYNLDSGELQKKLQEVGGVFCVGNLYTLRGIPKLLVGLKRFPQIHQLVIWGPDVQYTGDNLERAWGCNNTKEWDNQTKFTIPFDFSEFYELKLNIGITRVEERDIETLCNWIPVLQSNHEKLKLPDRIAKIFEEPQIEIPESYPSGISGFLIDAPDMRTAWTELVQRVMRFGVIKESQHIAKQKEILNVTLKIQNPYEFEKEAKYFKIGKEDYEKYFDQVLSEELPENLAYTPGYRLRGRWGDQLNKMVANLQKTPFSRRIVGNLWDSAFDIDNTNPPCITQVGMNISGETLEELYLSVQARSNDVYSALPMDLMMMAQLAEYIADEMDIYSGPLTYHITSAHIYEHDWEAAEKLIERSKSLRTRFIEDEIGNFIVESEGDLAKVTLIDPRGIQTLWEMTDTPEVVLKYIVDNRMVGRLDHMAYLAQEITRVGLIHNYEQGRA